MFSAGQERVVHKVLAALREKLGADLGLYDPDSFAWCWVVDFPLVEWDEDRRRWSSVHHPFTMPRDFDADRLHADPGSVRSRAYDLVCNGVELGGGSIRIHSLELQQQVFRLLGIGQREAHEKFDFLMNALRYGAPPHGGVALGLDRIVTMMVGGQSLRDVIAFPKTQRGTCPLTGAPARVDEKQLAELDLKLISQPKQ
ncbi:MAG: amino acid--tRNA ligase-related protein [Candidatus Bathyarchaeia archaeon]